MSKTIEKVSSENFPAAVKYAYKLNKKMHTNILAQNLLLPLGSMLFAILALFLLLGLAYAVVDEKNATLPVFDILPFVPDYSQKLWALLGGITHITFLKVLMTIALLYLLPFAVCGIIRPILSIFSAGEKPVFKGADAYKARQLYYYVAQGPFPKKELYDWQQLWCRISGIFVITCFVAIVSHALYVYLKPTNAAFWQYAVIIVTILLEYVLLYLLYARCYFLLTVLLKPCYSAPAARSEFLSHVKDYWLSLDPKARQRLKEEEAAAKESYDGWKYRNLENTLYYKEKFNEHYATYMGYPQPSQDDDITRLVRDVEDDLSGGGWGDY